MVDRQIERLKTNGAFGDQHFAQPWRRFELSKDIFPRAPLFRTEIALHGGALHQFAGASQSARAAREAVNRFTLKDARVMEQERDRLRRRAGIVFHFNASSG